MSTSISKRKGQPVISQTNLDKETSTIETFLLSVFSMCKPTEKHPWSFQTITFLPLILNKKLVQAFCTHGHTAWQAFHFYRSFIGIALLTNQLFGRVKIEGRRITSWDQFWFLFLKKRGGFARWRANLRCSYVFSGDKIYGWPKKKIIRDLAWNSARVVQRSPVLQLVSQS